MPRAPKTVRIWLASVCFLILSMIAVGGITRLTNSGLSIVDWKPIMGAIPPLTPAAWQETFDRYQRFPQYKLLNMGMTLEQFKFIFFWEYIHRLLGRIMGVVFILPWIYFVLRRQLDRLLAKKLLLGFLLGGLQGALGWFMVKSGLIDKPHVSHFRLAAHLSLALFVLCYLFWIWLGLKAPDRAETSPEASGRAIRKLTHAFIALIATQIIYGAFTAGLKAGFAYNTFPKMYNEWFPSEFFRMAPAWINPLENPAAVQFIHRTLGWLVLMSSAGLWIFARRQSLSKAQMRPLHWLLILVALQFALGVSILLLAVPVSLATWHQVNASLILLASLWASHALKPANPAQS